MMNFDSKREIVYQKKQKRGIVYQNEEFCRYISAQLVGYLESDVWR